jgi:hypothetical protein
MLKLLLHPKKEESTLKVKNSHTSRIAQIKLNRCIKCSEIREALQ